MDSPLPFHSLHGATYHHHQQPQVSFPHVLYPHASTTSTPAISPITTTTQTAGGRSLLQVHIGGITTSGGTYGRFAGGQSIPSPSSGKSSHGSSCLSLVSLAGTSLSTSSSTSTLATPTTLQTFGASSGGLSSDIQSHIFNGNEVGSSGVGGAYVDPSCLRSSLDPLQSLSTTSSNTLFPTTNRRIQPTRQDFQSPILLKSTPPGQGALVTPPPDGASAAEFPIIEHSTPPVHPLSILTQQPISASSSTTSVSPPNLMVPFQGGTSAGRVAGGTAVQHPWSSTDSLLEAAHHGQYTGGLYNHHLGSGSSSISPANNHHPQAGETNGMNLGGGDMLWNGNAMVLLNQAEQDYFSQFLDEIVKGATPACTQNGSSGGGGIPTAPGPPVFQQPSLTRPTSTTLYSPPSRDYAPKPPKLNLDRTTSGASMTGGNTSMDMSGTIHQLIGTETPPTAMATTFDLNPLTSTTPLQQSTQSALQSATSGQAPSSAHDPQGSWLNFTAAAAVTGDALGTLPLTMSTSIVSPHTPHSAHQQHPPPDFTYQPSHRHPSSSHSPPQNYQRQTALGRVQAAECRDTKAMVAGIPNMSVAPEPPPNTTTNAAGATGMDLARTCDVGFAGLSAITAANLEAQRSPPSMVPSTTPTITTTTAHSLPLQTITPPVQDPQHPPNPHASDSRASKKRPRVDPAKKKGKKRPLPSGICTNTQTHAPLDAVSTATHSTPTLTSNLASSQTTLVVPDSAAAVASVTGPNATAQSLTSPPAKRIHHIQSEKKRRRLVRHGFSSLIRLVPSLASVANIPLVTGADLLSRQRQRQRAILASTNTTGGGDSAAGVDLDEFGDGEEEKVDVSVSKSTVLFHTARYIRKVLRECEKLEVRIEKEKERNALGVSWN